MAGENTFPQIPSTVWKGVWSIFRKTASRKLDENILSIELNVQATAARQYLNELVRLNIIDANGAPTELASRWRQDGDDPDIIMEILKGAYPSGLLELAPPDALDRDKIVRWFLNQNLGEGAAKNKASTYMRIASGISAADAPRQNGGSAEQVNQPRKKTVSARVASPKASGAPAPPTPEVERRSGRPDLNVNIQIHISADASAEQIDAIFAGMRKYFD